MAINFNNSVDSMLHTLYDFTFTQHVCEYSQPKILQNFHILSEPLYPESKPARMIGIQLN